MNVALRAATMALLPLLAYSTISVMSAAARGSNKTSSDLNGSLS
jgi:hypothetical protein